MDSKDNTALAAASISSLLTSTKESLVFELAAAVQQTTLLLCSSQKMTSSTRGTMAGEFEIDVFDAELYYSMELEDQIPLAVGKNGIKQGKMKEEKDDLQLKRAVSRPVTQRASSEARWDGQDALCPSFMVNTSHHGHDNVEGAGLFQNRTFYDKRSIHVEVNSRSKRKELREEDRSNSADLLGSHKLHDGNTRAMTQEKKLSLLTWDAISESCNFDPASEATKDMDSDGSSDLFEIKDLSISAQPPCTMGAPYGITNSSIKPHNSASARRKAAKSGYATEKGNHRGLLGCNTEKAVRVAESAYRSIKKIKSDFKNRQHLDSSMMSRRATT